MAEPRQELTLDDIQRRHVAEHRKPYYDWLRQIVTLCSGALTLLVALQNNYVPQHPSGLWLLQFCWLSLACSILSGMVALYGESGIHVDAHNRIGRMRRTFGDAQTVAHIQANNSPRVKKVYTIAAKATFYCFVVSVLLLTVFGVVNVGREQQEPRARDHNTGR